MASTIRAMVGRDDRSFATNTVRLYVAEARGPHSTAHLMADGTWQVVEDGARLDDTGLVLPAAAVDAILEAIEELQGHRSHADTEARVLREWLTVERGRVDAVLSARNDRP